MAKRIAYMGIKGLPSTAGADRVVEAIVHGIDKARFCPTVYCSSSVVPKNFTLPEINLVRIPALPGKHLHAVSLFLFSALHSLCVGRYDGIHLHNVEASFIVPLLRMRYKVISTSHGAAQKRDKWSRVAKALISLTEYPYVYMSSCVTSVSQPLASYYKRVYKSNVYYLPNGVDDKKSVDRQAAQEILRAHNIEAGKYILFAAGRIIPTKGCHFLLEAFQHIADDVHLVIIGDMSHLPAYEAELRQMATHRIHFIPFIAAQEALLGLVSAARLFVFPSTVEAMSMMLLEVASMNTPLLCSDIPENLSVLPNQALYFASGNSLDLRDKLQWALDNPADMTRLARAAQQWVEDTFHWHSIIKQYERLYEDVLQK